MKNTYKQYVKPILAHLSSDACMELAYDKTFCEYLKTIRSPLFGWCGANKQDVITTYVYWSIVDLYSRAPFFNAVRQSDMQNFVVHFPKGKMAEVKKAYQKLTDLHGGFNAIARFDDMKTLVTYAKLKKQKTIRG